MADQIKTSDAAIHSAKSAPHAAIPDDIFCPECAYNLRGLTGDHCPECGYALGNVRAGTSAIPWTKRREIGRFRAYWQTIWMVRFRNRRFGEEYAHAVGYADSQAFRWVTILHAYLPVLAATLWVYLTIPLKTVVDPNPLNGFVSATLQSGLYIFDRAYAEVWPVALLHVCFLLFLAAATGVPSYFFHPRQVAVKQQNSAVGMSYYTCGPLALTFVPVAAVYATLQPSPVVGPVAGVLTAAYILLAWWHDLLQLMRRTMPQLKGRSVLVALVVPLLWFALAVLLLGVLPVVILAVLVLFASIR